MGTYRDRDTVPFKIELFTDEDSTRLSRWVPAAVHEYYEHRRLSQTFNDNWGRPTSEYVCEVNGWTTIVNQDVKPYIAYPFAVFEKGEHTVYLCNESPYEAGDGLDLSAFAETPEALEEFARDWGFVGQDKPEILKDARMDHYS
jgi:hypothetical protein